MVINKLCLRSETITTVSTDLIKTSRDAYELGLELWDSDTLLVYESFYLACLNVKNRAIGWSLISMGCTSYCAVDTKLLLSVALLSGCSSIIVYHNHPSGVITPSDSDNELTKLLVDAAKIVGLRLVDHIIIGGDGFYSYGDDGAL